MSIKEPAEQKAKLLSDQNGNYAEQLVVDGCEVNVIFESSTENPDALESIRQILLQQRNISFG